MTGAVGRRGRWAASGGDVSLGGGNAPHDWRSCARRYRIWDRDSIHKTAMRGRAAPVPFVPAVREAVFTLALFVIPLGPWAEEQVVPDGMGSDVEHPTGPHLLSLADVSALGFDCPLKPVAMPIAGSGAPTDLNTPVTTSDLPAFFPTLLDPPPISGASPCLPASIPAAGDISDACRRDLASSRPPTDNVVNKLCDLLERQHVLRCPSRFTVF